VYVTVRSVLSRLLSDENGDVVLLVPEVADGRGVAGFDRCPVLPSERDRAVLRAGEQIVLVAFLRVGSVDDDLRDGEFE